jgi:sulfur-carrier protein
MTILYFAWLRSKIGCGQESLIPPPHLANVQQLVDWLRQQSAAHADAFADMSLIRVAVNQDHAAFDHPLSPGDEVAFFPPVTGG